MAPETVKSRMQAQHARLTRAERLLVSVLLQDYPVAGLGSITHLAKSAGVSTPTVIRMARKLGFDGFPAMQAALRSEIAAQIKAPLLKKEAWRANAAEEHTLNQFADAISANLRNTLTRLDPAAFDAVVTLLADPQARLCLVGGRITRSIADYMFNHLQIIRPNVTLLSQSPNVWPQYLLDMDERSVLVLFDIRRYEAELQKLAKLARGRHSKIVLFTDQWESPIAIIADYTFNVQIEVPSSWDSTIAIMMIVEALISDVQGHRWTESRDRLEELEAMFGTTRIFRDSP
ncbi:MurR/RpiR family transcriptional regulator [Pseudoruegeria sp. SK021]|uniref:MurR/RpiR family transcriptional regulator n=1 Tax=Pseudoruegeria sp. SK021 TaxID=1933035 RepID=UPI000A24CAC5|nr:MurR/RpiR family transcriptional regulator [Pseudoruegeria sp. SK021]OSP55860.1 RpiR family transcriptional regulator [Pseudoruegeria sp. SK021]